MSRANARPARGRRCCRNRGGFTLIEMLTSIAILSIVMTATVSAIVLVGRATPQSSDSAGQLSDAAAVHAQISAELTYATGVSECAASAITFTVADRTGDGVADVIRYAWSGVAGAPLTRSLNGAAPAVLLPSVSSFSLVYDRYRQRNPPTYTEGDETLLHGYTATSSLSRQPISSSALLGQYVNPTFPADAEFWRITRLRVRATNHGGAGGETRVQVRESTGVLNTPSALVLEQARLLESDLPDDSTYADTNLAAVPWKEITFAGARRLPVQRGVQVVFFWVSDTHSCDVIYQIAGGPAGSSRSVDGGTSWTPVGTGTVPLQIWGRIATRAPDTYRTLLYNVRLTLAASEGAAATSGFQAHVALRNRPEVSAP